MPQKPSFPPPPLAPARAPAAHVQAAIGRTAQAKMRERALPAARSSGLLAPHVQSALAKTTPAQGVICPKAVIQLSSEGSTLSSGGSQKKEKKQKGEKFHPSQLANLFPEKPKQSAWGGEKKLDVNILGTGKFATAAAAKSEPEPTKFSDDCESLKWNNTLIEELAKLSSKPSRLWVRDLGEKKVTGETTYWSFNAMWVKSGQIKDGTLSGGSYVDGTLQLHFHPKAKETSNYLHIKKSDGSKPTAGEFKKDHWLVKAIGLKPENVTPQSD